MLLKKELDYFLVVSNFLNFSKASDYLGVQQSGLSKSIKKIENELNTKLFIRTSRGLRLTSSGKIVLNSLNQTQKIEDQLLKNLKRTEKSPEGNFCIGVHPVIGKFLLPKLLKDLEKFPKISVDIKFVTSRSATELVLGNSLDLAFAAMPLSSPNLIIKKMWKEYIGLYSLDGKLKTKLVYNSKMIDSQKLLRSINPKEIQKIDDYDILYSVLKRSDYMGLLPSPVAQREKKLKEIKIFKPGVDICYVYRADRSKELGFQTLINSIKSLEIFKS